MWLNVPRTCGLFVYPSGALHQPLTTAEFFGASLDECSPANYLNNISTGRTPLAT
jgi:hypothetical protein